nr:EAL domain-containing protein [uncultured Niameybacter sp.]
MEGRLKINFKWLMLLILGILIHGIQLPYILGTKLIFLGIVIVFLIRNYSIHITLITLAIIHTLAILLFDVIPFNLFFIIEAIWLGIAYKRNKECNLVLMDALLHITIGIPIGFIMIKLLEPSFSNEYNFFICAMYAVINIIAVLLGEILFNYVPVLFRGIRSDDTHPKSKIHLKNFLFHATLFMVSMPILGNTYINSVKNYELSIKQVEASAHSIFRTIQHEVGSWSNRDKQKLILYDVVYREKLKKALATKISDDQTNVIITNQQHKVILSTQSKYSTKELFNIENLVGLEEIDNEFYKIIPSKNMGIGIVHHYMDQYYIVHQCIVNPYINVYVNIHNKDYLVNELQIALDGVKLLMILWGFTIGLMILLDRMVFRSIVELGLKTKNLPDQIYMLDNIDWPENWTLEIAFLQQNFKKTAFKLKEMLESINKLNEELKASQKKMYELVYFDPLTHIGNRLKMKKDLNSIKEKAYYNTKLTGIFLLDIDRFKQINDTLGHEKGDKLLIEVAKRLKKIGEKEEIQSYRLGGDEFVVVAEKDNIEIIHKIGEEIVELFERSFIIDDACMQVGGSVGGSIYPYHTNDMDIAIRYADMAMYTSKEIGSTSLQMFNESIKEKYIKKTTIEKSIREAIANREFEIYYQPVYDLYTGKVINIEALLRWESKILGQVRPNVFIPIAEELGFMMSLDQWVIQNVCKQIKEWENRGISKVPVSINISQKYFKQKAFIVTLLSIIQKAKIRPEDVIIEIAESSVIEQAESMGKIIQELNDRGIQVILDDFGKKHSSISQLIDLPIKDLKLEYDLINGIDKDPRKQTLVGLIISIAHRLGIRTIAEGVETEAELLQLKEMQCDRGQGKKMCKPCRENEIIEILNYKENEK